MRYKQELEDFHLGEFKTELYAKVSDHRTIDQQRLKITGLLRSVLLKMEKQQ